MKRFLVVVGVVVSFALGGCAQLPKQAFNREAATHVRKVIVAHPENQEEYEAVVLGHPGMSFGLIGGLVAAADMQVKSGRLTKAIDPKEVRLQERFVAKVAAALSAAGYETTVLALPKDIKNEDVVAHVKKAAPNDDGVVVVSARGSYLAAGPTTDYQPRLVTVVRLVDLRTGTLLYQDVLSYGYPLPQAKTIHFPAEARYRFANIDALTADPTMTREGLYGGFDALAGQVAADLKRQ